MPDEIKHKAGFVIRDGYHADIDSLLEIEAQAAQLLLGHGAYDLFAMHTLSTEDIADGLARGIVRVAEINHRPVGFALCGEVDGHAHLFEMDVLPAYGRSGVGSALLESVCTIAGARGWLPMTLVTLRDVAWNAPFYAAHGFVEIQQKQYGPQLENLIARERMLGFPMQLRIVMQRF